MYVFLLANQLHITWYAAEPTEAKPIENLFAVG